MESLLTAEEKRFVSRYIRSVKQDGPFYRYRSVYSILVMLTGILLFAAAVIITVKEPVDRVILWVLIPGVVFGGIIAAVGVYLFYSFRRAEEKRKVAQILIKLTHENRV